MRAAIFHQVHEPLTIEEIEHDAPQPREVVVKVVASGVCHSDLHFIDGLYPMRPPAVLGHEAAGVVEAVGSQVTDFEPGDRVISCLSVFCGTCENCLSGHPSICSNRPIRGRDDAPRLTWNGDALTQGFQLGAYAERMLVHENALVKITQNIELDRAALIGCGVTTGVGAVLNTARIEAGSTVAVWGCGGVGLAAIQGARIAGARTIIAVDVVEAKLGTARELGATHSVDASSSDPVQAIRSITGRGADYTFEAIGSKVAAEQAWDALRPGGTATIIGMIPVGEKVEIEGRTFLSEKKIQGSSMGSNRFRIDMPRYIDMYLDGRLKLDELVSARIGLDDINDGFEAMKRGEVARSVIVF
jgi:S-(hydroxymethyl)glutathione dehydrogenase/alcohol dehydrogenase